MRTPLPARHATICHASSCTGTTRSCISGHHGSTTAPETPLLPVVDSRRMSGMPHVRCITRRHAPKCADIGKERERVVVICVEEYWLGNIGVRLSDGPAGRSVISTVRHSRALSGSTQHPPKSLPCAVCPFPHVRVVLELHPRRCVGPFYPSPPTHTYNSLI
ncbi:hypothetical protein BKA93DRAFT_271792 [Sparassis latifolia]